MIKEHIEKHKKYYFGLLTGALVSIFVSVVSHQIRIVQENKYSNAYKQNITINKSLKKGLSFQITPKRLYTKIVRHFFGKNDIWYFKRYNFSVTNHSLKLKDPFKIFIRTNDGFISTFNCANELSPRNPDNSFFDKKRLLSISKGNYFKRSEQLDLLLLPPAPELTYTIQIEICKYGSAPRDKSFEILISTNVGAYTVIPIDVEWEKT